MKALRSEDCKKESCKMLGFRISFILIFLFTLNLNVRADLHVSIAPQACAMPRQRSGSTRSPMCFPVRNLTPLMLSGRYSCLTLPSTKLGLYLYSLP